MPFIFYSYLACIVIQLIFLLFIFSRLITYKETDTGFRPGVSVIVAAHNEEQNLLRLLPALLQQDYYDFEIIIALDRCTDGSLEVLKKYSSGNLRFITIDTCPAGYSPKKYALTQAVEASRKEYLLFTDADCIPRSELWIRKMTGSYKPGTEIVLGYSQYVKQPGWLNRLIRFETLYTGIQYLSFALAHKPYMGVGRNLSYRKELFFRHHGYSSHIHLAGGDDDLFVRDAATSQNTAICLSPEGQTLSLPKKNLNDWLRQKTRHLHAGKKYKLLDRCLLGLLYFTQAGVWTGFFILELMQLEPFFTIFLFSLRTLALITIFACIQKRFKDQPEWYFLPYLDFLYVVYYIAAGTRAIFAKKS